ncbi:hypothetical protein ABZ467_30455 [Streptomyces sp. NPDC005727]|uniref:hypothetical protein n=1 Tax=unclassified Streptomyces TaxID=2593676 RepID=UPI0033C24F13
MSTIQVEKVVKAPRKPTAANGRTYRVGGQISNTYTSSSAGTNAPDTLTANVAHGNPTPGAGKGRHQGITGRPAQQTAERDRRQDAPAQTYAERLPSYCQSLIE